VLDFSLLSLIQYKRDHFQLVLSIIRAFSENTTIAFSQVSPQVLQIIQGLGITSHLILEIGRGAICCIAGIMIVIVKGAIGGAIYASIKPS